jgi:hypothetical protein
MQGQPYVLSPYYHGNHMNHAGYHPNMQPVSLPLLQAPSNGITTVPHVMVPPQSTFMLPLSNEHCIVTESDSSHPFATAQIHPATMTGVDETGGGGGGSSSNHPTDAANNNVGNDIKHSSMRDRRPKRKHRGSPKAHKSPRKQRLQQLDLSIQEDERTARTTTKVQHLSYHHHHHHHATTPPSPATVDSDASSLSSSSSLHGHSNGGRHSHTALPKTSLAQIDQEPEESDSPVTI